MILYFDNYDDARQAFKAATKANNFQAINWAHGAEMVRNTDGEPIQFRVRTKPQQVITKKCCSCHE